METLLKLIYQTFSIDVDDIRPPSMYHGSWIEAPGRTSRPQHPLSGILGPSLWLEISKLSLLALYFLLPVPRCINEHNFPSLCSARPLEHLNETLGSSFIFEKMPDAYFLLRARFMLQNYRRPISSRER